MSHLALLRRYFPTLFAQNAGGKSAIIGVKLHNLWFDEDMAVGYSCLENPIQEADWNNEFRRGAFMRFKPISLCSAVIALAMSAGSASAALITVSDYLMRNGDGILQQGTFNYLDTPYSGGNGGSPGVDLSGGKGILTDGVAPVASWDFAPTEYVGWKYFNPSIIFDFASPSKVGEVDIYVSGANGGLVGLPAVIWVNGSPVSFSIQDIGTAYGYNGVDKLSIFFAGGLSTSELTLQFFAGPALADAIAIDPANDPFIIDPRTGFKTTLEPWLMVSEVQFLSAVPEPSTWIMMLLGFAGIAFMAAKRAKKLETAAVA